jgi:endonuclease/exonuclease/phosphatase family metal-dependent hydrolase
MRPVIRRIVQNLPPPGGDVLAEARRASPSRAEHRRFVDGIEAFHALEYQPPSQDPVWPGVLRLAAFNTERLRYRPALRRLLDQVGAHVTLLSEVDVGMARSGNVHTVRELIGSAGEGYSYGVEFVELDLGNAQEMRRHAGERNVGSFHGNAILTKLALEQVCLIPLEESGFWFPGYQGAQRRIGGRMALAARVSAAPRPLWVVSVHLESKTDPQDRQAQIRNLLRALDALAPDDACVIGGDFNTKALPREGDAWNRLFDSVTDHEPLFADLAGAGFDWAGANLARPTQRIGPSNKPESPFGKLDWIVVRGVAVENPQVVPALDEQAHPISDHEMLTVDLKL